MHPRRPKPYWQWGIQVGARPRVFPIRQESLMEKSRGEDFNWQFNYQNCVRAVPLIQLLETS